VGSNLWTLANEIDKLIKFSGAKPISERDIETVCDPGIETAQFALSNAFAKGSEIEVMNVFEHQIDAGESAYSLLYRDLGPIVRQFLLARTALDERKGAKEVGLNPFIFGRIKNTTAKFPFEHLREMQEKLVQIDEGVKTGLIPVVSGKEDLLFFALENWIREFFRKK